MNQKASDLVQSLNKNNEEIYGKAVAEFISTTALHYGYTKSIVEVIDKSTSPEKDKVTLMIVDIFAQNSSLLAHKLEIGESPQDYLSYLLLGKKMFEKVQDIVRESAH